MARRLTLTDRRKARERAEHRLTGLGVAAMCFAAGAGFLALLLASPMSPSVEPMTRAVATGSIVFLAVGSLLAGFLSLWSVRK